MKSAVWLGSSRFLGGVRCLAQVTDGAASRHGDRDIVGAGEAAEGCRACTSSPASALRAARPLELGRELCGVNVAAVRVWAAAHRGRNCSLWP